MLGIQTHIKMVPAIFSVCKMCQYAGKIKHREVFYTSSTEAMFVALSGEVKEIIFVAQLLESMEINGVYKVGAIFLSTISPYQAHQH